MKRVVVVAVACGLVFAGWSIGRAQGPVADFELLIEAPAPGRVNVTCLRGCQWGDLARLGQPNTVYFSCGGTAQRCPGVIDGRGIVIRRPNGPSNRPPLTPSSN